MTRADKQGLVLLVFVFLVFALLLVLMWRLSSADNIDPETLCRIGKEGPALKLLIDKTDPWDQHTQRRLATLIRALKLRLAPHERLSIYILDETGTYSSSPVFDMCNPGRGEQANDLYQNPGRIQQKFEEKFAAPLDALLETLLHPGTAPRSPIIETIQGLRGKGAQERLIVVSDMMQNSEELSFYGHSQTIIYDEQNDICSMDNPYESVQVYFINRPAVRVTRKQGIRNFWDKCLGQVAWKTEWDVL